jgi:hypothetical protein
MVHNASNSIINQAGIGDLLLQKAGTTKASITANGLEFPDNSKAIFGAGSDLQIYHDGSNSWIQDAGTGVLALKTDGVGISMLTATGDTLFQANRDSDVRLYYDNALKLSTSATGIDVTGTVTADTGEITRLGLGVAAHASAALYITTTDQHIRLNNGSELGVIELDSSGHLNIWAHGDGETINLKTGSGAGANVLSVVGNNVGIGTSSPKRLMHLNNAAALTTKIQITNLSTGSSTDGDGFQIGISNDGTANIEQRENLALTFSTNNQERLRIDASGRVGIGRTPSLTNSKLEVGGADNVSLINVEASGVTGGMGIGSTGLQFFHGSSAKMRIDSSGNVGIGATPSAWGSSTPALQILNASIYGYGTYESGHSTNLYYDAGWKHISTQVASQYRQTIGGHQWFNAASASAGATATMVQAMTLDASGHFLINEPTSYAAEAVQIKCLELGGNAYGIIINGPLTSNTAMRFFNSSGSGVTVGSITFSASATSYNTSSDYRLKENVVGISGATERLKQLKPSRFNFIADADTTVDGFLAHEVQDIVPEAITGTKDAMMDEEYEVAPAVLDDDGNVVTEAVMGTRSVPDYQGIDQSKLVPLLVATIQELEARIAALES